MCSSRSLFRSARTSSGSATTHVTSPGDRVRNRTSPVVSRASLSSTDNRRTRPDSNSFGAQFLAKSGHVEGTALGSPSGSGLINPIAVSRKMDNSGIGVGRARKEGGTEAHSAGLAGVGLDDVLRRLRGEGSASPGGEKVLGGFAKAGVSDLKDTIVVRDDSSASASDAGSPASETSNKPRRLA